MKNMFQSAKSTRRVLILIWWISFVANLVIVLYFLVADEIDAEEFWPAVQKINGLYVPYLGAITAFYWGTGGSITTAPQDESRARTANILAIGCSLLWNCMILLFMVRLLIPIGTIDESLEMMEKLGGIFVWLVAPALGFYFAKS